MTVTREILWACSRRATPPITTQRLHALVRAFSDHNPARHGLRGRSTSTKWSTIWIDDVDDQSIAFNDDTTPMEDQTVGE